MGFTKIQRKLTLNRKEYYQYGTLIGYSRYTKGFFPDQLILLENGRPKYMMKESSRLRWLCGQIPLLGVFTCRTYEILICNSEETISESDNKWWKPALCYRLDGDLYHLRIHNHERFSLTRNEVQIALYVKEEVALDGKNTYFIYFSDSEAISIVFLFCIFIDIFYFDHDGLSVPIREKWKYHVRNDPHPEYADWRPEGWNIGYSSDL